MLPDGLERLEFLRTLDLSNNQLKEIPPGLGEMRSERERERVRGREEVTSLLFVTVSLLFRFK